jgi:glycosyltransferase involved in cell wall biosynthesis
MSGRCAQWPVSNEMIARLMLECRAFVFPGIEDFGITPIEANAAGAPVIAYAEGGVLETVTEKTGVFFQSQTVAALKAAVLEFESGRPTIQASDCRERAGQFTRDRFQRELRETIRETWRVRGRNPAELDQALS